MPNKIKVSHFPTAV